MLNIFQLADNDQSVYYLGQIFGNVGFGLAGTGPALLATMFKVLNTSLLAIAAVIITYTTIMGVIKTAQEGELMGKNWSSIWIPLRIVLGIVALFPTKVGYCAIQVVFMWFIVQGVGVADMVWTATVNYLAKGGAIQTPAPNQAIVDNVPTIMKQVFGDAVCQAIITKFSSNNADAQGHSTMGADGVSVLFGRPGNTVTLSECGTVRWGIQTGPTLSLSEKLAIQDAQGQAIKTIVPVMEALANRYVNQILKDKYCWDTGYCSKETPQYCTYFGKYQTFYYNRIQQKSCGVNWAASSWSDLLSFGGSNFMTESVRLFAGYANNYAITYAMKNQKNVPGTNIPADASQTYKNAQVNGWLFAGGFYYFIANQNNGVSAKYQQFVNGIAVNNDQPNCGSVCDLSYRLNNNASSGGAYPDFDITKYPNAAVAGIYCGGPFGPDMSDSSPCKPTENIGALGVADQAIQAMKAASSAGGGGLNLSVASSDNPVAAFFQSIAKSIFEGFAGAIAPQGDNAQNPIVTLQSFGHGLLAAADVVFLLVVGLAITFGVVSTNISVFGTTVNFAAGMGGALLALLLPVAGAILAYMVSIGALLGVYMPLVPFTLFAFGVIGWFTAVIEAMIAAPLVALGIMMPSGQHEIMGKSGETLMMILNIFLRPTLMVFGMMAGMLMSYVVIKFINAAFYNVIINMTGGATGLIEGFLFLMAYAGLVLTALNKCFALIHMIPDRVLVWIGGHPQGYGEEAAAEQVKGKVSAGGEAAGGAGRQAASSGAGSLGQIRQEKKAEEKEAKADKQAQKMAEALGIRKNDATEGSDAAAKPAGDEKPPSK